MSDRDPGVADAPGRRAGRRAGPRSFGVGRIALRQLRSRPALAVAQGLTLVAAVTLLASVALIQGTATDSGLRTALRQAASVEGSNLLIERDGVGQTAVFDTFQRSVAARVRAEIGDSVAPGAEIGKSPAQVLRSIDGVAQGQPLSNLSSVSYYAGLRDHVRLVAGHWPGDSRAGPDWQLTASAHATDTLGTPLDLHVGSEYCFSTSLNRGINVPWCGRVAATWLPDDVTDPFWAGHVPETDVLTGHDSFFHIAALFPGALSSAIQQYVPDPARISGSNAAAIVQGVTQLRGYYSVSSNDVFVSGLDTTITTFLARQAAASGPMLVTAVGLLAVALAAMAFAALQFISGHSAQVAVWRARGWSRLRVWALFATEMAILSVAATPLAVLAAAATSAAVAGASSTRPALSWQSLANAALPSAIAAGAFLAVLTVLAATRSGPELAQRRSDRAATRSRSWRRRGVDVLLVASGTGILLLVRFAGDDSAGAGQTSGLVLALPVVAVALLALASLRLVGVTAGALALSSGVGARLARWQLERDPGQFARLCLLVTLAVAVGVFASTYTASDRASAIDRADYMVGADMRATFTSAASPPQLNALASSLPGGVRSAQVFRGVGRPGRTGTDATVVGIQGAAFWDIAYWRSDFATPSLPTLTATMASADPDGAVVPGAPRVLSVTAFGSGVDVRVALDITDARGREAMVPMGAVTGVGWTELIAPLDAGGQPLAYPIRVRALRVTPHGSATVGDVAFENLRTDTGAIVESFAAARGWWAETFAPDTAEATLTPTRLRSRDGEPSADVPVNVQTVLIEPPPTSRPLPVLLAASTMAALGVALGQAFPVHMDTVDVQLVAVGTFDAFPTHYAQREDLIVAPMSSLLARLGNQGATSPWPNELWLQLPVSAVRAVTAQVSADPTLLSSSLRSDAESAALNDPLRAGIDDELGLGFLVALAVVVVGFGLHFLAAARNRVTQFAVMRANGVPQATLRGALVAEQVIVLLSGLVAGTVIGLALSWAVVPIFHLGSLPEDLTPPSLFHLDPLTLGAVVAGTGLVALIVGRLVAGSGSRVDVMATVRSLT